MQNSTGGLLDGATAASNFMWETTRLLFYAVSHDEMLGSLPSKWKSSSNSTGGASSFGSLLSERSVVTLNDLSSAKIPEYTLMAVPGFIILCAIELFVGLARGKTLYRINDASQSFMLGAVMLLFQCIIGPTVGLSTYCWIWSNYGLQGFIPLDSWCHYIFLLLAADCGYYWFHRTAHEYHFSWSAHSVHHSGEDYNFATALRQGALQSFTSWPFYLLPAFLFHPALFVMHRSLNTLGQFWIHTTIIGHVGTLEYILNTPSHHRMHHRPPGNCNYAGVLIIWDRMFGTFVGEKKQKDYYGLAKQYQTFDPLWANMEHVKRQIQVVGKRKNKTLFSYFSQFFRKRAHHPFVFQPFNIFKTIHPNPNTLWNLPEGSSQRIRLESQRKHFLLTAFVVFEFLCTLGASIGLLLHAKGLTTTVRIGTALVLMLSLSVLGRLLDGTNMALFAESCRTLSLAYVFTFELFQPQGMPIPKWFALASQIRVGVWFVTLAVSVVSFSSSSKEEKKKVEGGKKVE